MDKRAVTKGVVVFSGSAPICVSSPPQGVVETWGIPTAKDRGHPESGPGGLAIEWHLSRALPTETAVRGSEFTPAIRRFIMGPLSYPVR